MRIFLISAAFLFAATLSAQTKVEAALEYLGERYSSTMPAGKAVWKFRDGDIHTEPNGTWSFEKDLTGRFAFQNGVSYGPLLSITVNGKVIPRSAPVAARSAQKPERPKELVTRNESAIPLTDSSTAALELSGYVDAGKQGYDWATKQGKDAYAEFWELYMYVQYFIWCVMILVWFWADFTKNEYQASGTWGDNMLFNIQRNSSSILALLLLINVTLYCVEFMIGLSEKESMPKLLRIILVLAVVAAVKWLANKFTPSITSRSAGGNGRALPPGGNNYKQLN